MAKQETPEKGKKADKSVKQTKPGKPAKPSLAARLVGYIRDVRSEMKRVVWPSRPEVMNSSLVVIVTLVFFILFISVTDQIVIQVLALISKIGG